MGAWRAFVSRPSEVVSSEAFYGGPVYIAGYTPTSEDTMYAFLVEPAQDRSALSAEEHAHLMYETSLAYDGPWNSIRADLLKTPQVNYTWFTSHLVPDAWNRGRVVIIGDAAHSCPPTIAQGAAQALEDASSSPNSLRRTTNWTSRCGISSTPVACRVRLQWSRPRCRSGSGRSTVTSTPTSVASCSRSRRRWRYRLSHGSLCLDNRVSAVVSEATSEDPRRVMAEALSAAGLAPAADAVQRFHWPGASPTTCSWRKWERSDSSSSALSPPFGLRSGGMPHPNDRSPKRLRSPGRAKRRPSACPPSSPSIETAT